MPGSSTHRIALARLTSMGTRTTLVSAVLAVLALTAAGGLVAAAGSAPGSPTRGKALFLRPGVFCSSCHTLKATGSTGRDGPNLDPTRSSYARIVEYVTKGRNPSKRWPTGMPHYGPPNAELSKAEIQDVAAFVYAATHK